MMMTMLPRDMLLNVSTYVGGTSFVSLCVTSKSWNHLLQHSARYEKEQVAHRKERVTRFRAQFAALDISIQIPVEYHTEEIIDPMALFYPVRLDASPRMSWDFYKTELSDLSEAEITQAKARCAGVGLKLFVRFKPSVNFLEFGGPEFHAAIAARETALCANAPRLLRLFRQHQQLLQVDLPRLKLPAYMASLYWAGYTRDPDLNQFAVDQVKYFSVSALREAVVHIESLETDIAGVDLGGFGWTYYGGASSSAASRPFRGLMPRSFRSHPLDVDAYVRKVCEEARELVMRPFGRLEEQRRFAHAQVAEFQRAYDEGVVRSTTPRLRAILQRDVTDQLDQARVFAEQTEVLVEFDAELRTLWKKVLRPIAGPPPPSFGLKESKPFVTRPLVHAGQSARPSKRACV